MKQPFKLITCVTAGDTAKCLSAMLREAEAGRLIGIAYAAMYSGRTYAVNACGDARRSPTFARGMVSDLHEALGKLRPG